MILLPGALLSPLLSQPLHRLSISPYTSFIAQGIKHGPESVRHVLADDIDR
jgi:hypothetical protein